MKKNIAIFQTDLNIGGIQKSLINLLNRIDYKKYNIDLYLFSEGLFIKKIPKKVNIIKIDSKKYLKYLPFSFYKLLKFKVTDKKYDYAIDFNGYNNVLSKYVLSFKASKKIIWIHNDYEEKKKYEKKFQILFSLSKSKYKLFDEYVSVSNGVKNSFYKVTGLISNYVIQNYIDTTEIIDSSKENIDFYVDEEKINICFLGRLVQQKGLFELLNIMENYKKKNELFHLYIIGDGPLKESLINETEKLDLFDNVTFLGNKENPFPYLNLCDYLILNSKYEGQGMVLLEALSLGLKIIMPKRLEKYVNIDYIDIDDLDNLTKFKKKKNKLLSYNKNIDKEIDKLLGDIDEK